MLDSHPSDPEKGMARTVVERAVSLGADPCRGGTWLRWLIVVFAMSLLTSCAGTSSQRGPAPAPPGPPVPADGSHPVQRLKRDVERLISIRFDDIEALEQQLDTHLGRPGADGRASVRKARGGTLAGVALKDVELHGAPDHPEQARLLLRFGATDLLMDDVPWPAAILHPPHPDAPDGHAYGSLEIQGAAVILGLGPDQTHLSYISIRKR